MAIRKTAAALYRPDIDGLRGVAILAVVLYHGGFFKLNNGFTGVDIFFVISGYLIGGQIWASALAGTFSYREFYRRRAKRILPAFYEVLILVMAAGLVLFSPAELQQLARDATAATLAVSNVVFWAKADYFAGKSEFNPLLMTWSLGVEEQFYALAPLLMLAVGRARRRWALPAVGAICVASFIFAWMEAASRPMLAFYLLPARAWELGAGVALAISEQSSGHRLLTGWKKEAAGIAGMALMAAAMAAHMPTVFPGRWTWMPVAGAALAIAAPESWVNRRVLAAAPLRFTGKISYSWYLWHWPLLAFLRILYGGAAPPMRNAEAIAASFVLAAISYRVIEQPFRRSAQPAPRLLIRYGLASAALLAVCAALWLGRGWPQRFPALERMEAAGTALESEPCLANLNGDQPNLSTACYDAASAQPQVALWGDSHAAALAPGIRAQAAMQGYGLALFSKASCQPLTGATHFVPRLPLLADKCLRFNRRVMEILKADRRIQVVILHAVWAAPLYSDWQDGWLSDGAGNRALSDTATRALLVSSLRWTAQELAASGKRVMVLDDVPGFDIDPLLRIRSQQIPARRVLTMWLRIANGADPGFSFPDPDLRVSLATELIKEAAAGIEGVTVEDLKPALCSQGGACYYRRGNDLLYIDSGHLSAAGALYAARNFPFPRLDAQPEEYSAR